MLYFLHLFTDVFSVLNVFRYVSVRAALAFVTSLAIGIFLGKYVIEKLKQIQFVQYVRDEGPEHHKEKQGTPTMGGILIIISIVVSVLLWANLTKFMVWIMLFSIVGFGGIGLADDLLKVSKSNNLGLTSKQKFLLQVLCSIIVFILLYYMKSFSGFEFTITFPIFKNFQPDLGLFFVIFVILVIVGASNAVNLTDGLDGLAVGTITPVVVTLSAVAYASGHKIISEYLNIPYIPEASELTIIGSAIIGSLLGFLWHNAQPADMFMGDVGSLSLGGALGTMAVLIKEEYVLFIAGGVLVIEALSVIIQVGSFKTRGKRVFRMAPIHHHFELKNWAENKVVVRFWIISLLFSLIALVSLKLR